MVSVYFQILGGVLLPNNKYGAIVEKVKKGSAADCEGRLLPGKNYSQRMSQVHGKKDNTSSSLNMYQVFYSRSIRRQGLPVFHWSLQYIPVSKNGNQGDYHCALVIK
jgi:hypothetical protein